MGITLRSKLTVLVVALLALTGTAALNTAKAGASYVQDCKANSIMRCGAGTPADFIAKTQANAPGDLKTVYADYGLVSSQYSKFVTSARAGVVYKSDGRIVVDGQTVATNAFSLGRDSKSYSSAKTIGGKTYYQSSVKNVMLNDSLPVMVMFDAKGVMQFAVMDACGNPMTASKVTPTYSCDVLQKTAVAGKKDTYNFIAKTSAAGNAKVVKVTYDMGDGSKIDVTNLNTVVQHTYKTPGTYTATVTVYVSLPGNQTVTVTSAKCKTVTVVEQPKVPFQQCVSLVGAIINKEQRNYAFTVTTSQGNGSTLKSASFDFGDGVKANDLAPTTTTSVKTTHVFNKEGKYTVVAAVSFNTASGVQSVTCSTAIDTGTTPVCATNPNLPENSPECKPCEFNAQLPANSPDCKKPEVLVNTGAGSMLGIFTVSSIAAGFGYRRFLLRRGL
ncbi:MAG: PKD domain-containing protein [Candidatus Saccharimonadales bacterium]